MLNLPIYLDNHSTTKVDNRVFEAMRPYFTEIYGNASSKSHEFGWIAEAAVEKARGQVANLIGAEKKEIIFTSGATESNNLAIKGVAESYIIKGNHIITCTIEHKAVLDVCKSLEIKGYNVTYLPVDEFGLVDLDELRNAINKKTILVSIMFANNEIGTLQPIEEIGKICKERRVLFHTDATQAVGKIEVDVEKMSIDLLSMSAHKIYGPKGIGAVYVRNKNPRVVLKPQIDGGGHERGFRTGTLNVPGIIGLGAACEIAGQEMNNDEIQIGKLRDKLYEGIKENIGGVYLNGHPTKRLYNNLNLRFDYVNADSLMMALKDIAVSSGSACSSETPEPSHVLKAIGVKNTEMNNSIRFGMGRFTTDEEIDYTIKRVTEEVKKLREMSIEYQMSLNKTLELQIEA